MTLSIAKPQDHRIHTSVIPLEPARGCSIKTSPIEFSHYRCIQNTEVSSGFLFAQIMQYIGDLADACAVMCEFGGDAEGVGAVEFIQSG